MPSLGAAAIVAFSEGAVGKLLGLKNNIAARTKRQMVVAIINRRRWFLRRGAAGLEQERLGLVEAVQSGQAMAQRAVGLRCHANVTRYERNRLTKRRASVGYGMEDTAIAL